MKVFHVFCIAVTKDKLGKVSGQMKGDIVSSVVTLPLSFEENQTLVSRIAGERKDGFRIVSINFIKEIPSKKSNLKNKVTKSFCFDFQ